MSIKKKLVLFYVLMVILPLCIFGVSMSAINQNILNTLKGENGGTDPNSYFSGELRFYRELQRTYEKDPVQLLKIDYLNDLLDRFHEVVGLEVIVDGNLIMKSYKSTPREFPNELVSGSTYNLKIEDQLATFHIKHVPIFGPAAETRIKSIFKNRAIWSIGVYLLLNFVFLIWVMKYFLPPFEQLKQVAKKISQKDYNITIDTDRHDEIGEAFIAFEDMRNALQVYENNRKDLIANISHDLKTPITAIKGYVTAIQDGLASTPEKLNKYIDVISNNAVHLEQLVDDLFLYSKLDVDQVSFDMNPIHFEKYMDYLIDEIRLELEPKAVEVAWSIGSCPHAICAIDTFKMKRVIQNIVTNAGKHFDKPTKTLTFALALKEKAIALSITDNGEGIPQRELDMIFQKFYRGDSSRNTSTGSSGLGLAISQQIIEKHQGTISAKSIMGVGTTITIELPIVGV